MPEGDGWLCLSDTNVPERIEEALHEFGEVYQVTGRARLLFALERRGRQSRAARSGRGALLDVAEDPFTWAAFDPLSEST